MLHLARQGPDSLVPVEAIASAENLLAAWRQYRAGKRRRPAVAWFELDAERNLLDLAEQVLFRAGAIPRLGRVDDARPLVAYAADVGFRVTLVDHRPALLDPAGFPQAVALLTARPDSQEIALPPAARTLAVVKSHSLAIDRAWVRRLLAADIPYVGVLGPRARTESMLHEIGATAAEQERVFGPVGLDLGADGPRQVALSIVAEMLAFTTRRTPGHLAARREAIHV